MEDRVWIVTSAKGSGVRDVAAGTVTTAVLHFLKAGMLLGKVSAHMNTG